jgi:hypothetical protein
VNVTDLHPARLSLLGAGGSPRLDPLTSEQFTRDMGNSFRSIRDTVSHIYAPSGPGTPLARQMPTAFCPPICFRT